MKKWRTKPDIEQASEPDLTDQPIPEMHQSEQAQDGEPSPSSPGPNGQSAAAPVDGGDDTDMAPDTQTEAPETVALDRLLRLQADFENYRKRVIRERADHTERATEDLMLELLPVMDHFDIALRHAEESSTDVAMIEGFRLVAEQLGTALRKFGLEPLDAEGLPFDPHQHEAVAHLPDADCPDGVVMAQTRRGFRLGGKLLRAAQVLVSSGPPADAGSVEGQEE